LFKIDIIFPSFFQEEASAIKAAGKAWYNTMVSDSDYAEFDNFSKWLGVSQ
jgi:large subunit ribosomal protein L4e